jgi:hypothetical protein
MTALEDAADAMPDRHILWAEFDPMLADMASALAGLCRHFGLAAEPGQVQAVAGGPLMQRYSKALEYDYSAALRSDLVAEAGALFRREIDQALADLSAAASDAPLLARALARQ